MSTNARDLYRPPGDRSESEIAADVIVMLIEHRVGGLTLAARTIAQAAAATGIPVSAIKEAWEKRGLPGRELRAPEPKPAKPDLKLVPIVPEPKQAQRNPQPSPQYSPNYHPAARKANEAKRAKKEPVKGKRFCAKCNELKPKAAFAVMSKRTGKLSSWCKPCLKEYKADRYLSSQKLKALGPALRFILEQGDEHAGLICPDCHQPCRPGDEVLATDAILRHASHHEHDEPARVL